MNVKLYIGSRNAANHKAQMKEQTKTFKRCYLQYRNKQDNKMIGKKLMMNKTYHSGINRSQSKFGCTA